MVAKSPVQLIAELISTGDQAIANWAHSFRLVKPFGMPHPSGVWLSLRHLMLVIHSRDTWIHRLDICRATDRLFVQTQEHDGRVNALVVRDLANRCPANSACKPSPWTWRALPVAGGKLVTASRP